MNKLIFMCGLPGSGKSYFAEKIAQKENAIILSSDNLRVELFNNINHQNDNDKLFNELFKRVDKLLNNDRNVIVDACNINRRRRTSILERFKNYRKECYYVNTPYYFCLKNDRNRNRNVGGEVIKKMYLSLHVPSYLEGWDSINCVNNFDIDYNIDIWRDNYEYIILKNNVSYDELFNELEYIEEFYEIYEFPQDTPHHTFSVSRHTYYVYDYIKNVYQNEDKLIMLWAALLHDIGKPFCKNFKNDSRYANFIGHENVSAQLAFNLLYRFGYNLNFILKVIDLVQLHMKLLQIETDKAIKKLENYVGKDIFNKLLILREADVSAK